MNKKEEKQTVQRRTRPEHPEEGRARTSKFELHRMWNNLFEKDLLGMYQEGLKLC